MVKGLPQNPSTPGNVLTHFPIDIDPKLSAMRYVPQYVITDNHDAFDPLSVDPSPLVPNGQNGQERGYNLIPLIFSAGPNGNLNAILNGTAGDLNGYGLYSGLDSSWAQLSSAKFRPVQVRLRLRHCRPDVAARRDRRRHGV